jgi:MFS family permease
VKGYPTFHVGLMMMASPVAMGLVAPLSGSISDRFGTRAISVVGLSVIITGFYAISTLTENTSVVGYLMRVFFVGMGMGIFQSPNNSAIMGAVPPERLGVASGLMALARNLGTTIGIPLMGAICTSLVVATSHLSEMSNIVEAPASALVHGLNGTFRVSAMILGISTVLFSMVLLMERRRGGSPV